MKIVIPMAGRGSRFGNSGMNLPKPLIPVAGKPMVAWALESLKGLAHSQIIFVALAEHEAQYSVCSLLHSFVGSSAQVFLIDGVTEGQLCTVLTARDLIDSDEDFLIASADTYVVSNLATDIAKRAANCRGIISVANLPGDHWSFARADSAGRVVEVAEKTRISGYASTGLYYFASGSEFVQVADDMIRNQEKTRGEYYVIPVYQKYIHRGLQVDISLATQVWDMGTPNALAAFEQHLVDLPGLGNLEGLDQTVEAR